MSTPPYKTSRKVFYIKIILPAIMSIALFIISIYAVILPAFESNIMDRKREMIKELTNSAWSILAQYEKEEKAGTMSRAEAQKAAVSNIKYLRYGEENKDYFWITDMQPNMVMHPYRPDLDSKSLSEFTDPHGKKLFVEFVKVVEKDGQGYMDYMWQWKDDASRIVPKLSFVRGFKPWGWIIGTGIYTEDVKAEIASMEGRLIKISLFIMVLVAILMIFILRQSIRTENQRKKAEADLSNSRERYKALVEASSEGSLMLLDGFVYANNSMLRLLGYSESEIGTLGFNDIISDEKFSSKSLGFADLVSLFNSPKQFESKLRHRDGRLLDVLLSISTISLAGKDAIILLTKELKVSAPDARINNRTTSRAGQTADKSGIGVFRTTLARKSMFVEANEAAILVFSGKNGKDLFGANIEDFFDEDDERRSLVKELISHGVAQRRFLKIRKTDKSTCYIRVALSLVIDENTGVKYCDGIAEDVTQQYEFESNRSKIIESLQTSAAWMDLPAGDLAKKEPIKCGMYITVKKAAGLLKDNAGDALLIEDTNGMAVGIVTHAELGNYLSTDTYDAGSPVYRIMRSPLQDFPEHGTLLGAFTELSKNNLSHLIVRTGSGKVRGVIKAGSFLDTFRNTSEVIRRDIIVASSVTELKSAQERMKQSVLHSVNIGLNPDQLTRIIAETSEAIQIRLIELAIAELGSPPAAFAFISLGSVGRSEQTLATDQDNAIIFEDVPEENEEAVRNYFQTMGSKICNELDLIGYEFCKGKIMAQNPKFCQPLHTWKNYFTDWVNTAEPQDLLDANIFFDLKFSYGSKAISDELLHHLHLITENNNAFFYHLALNTLSLKTPVGFFGNIIKDSKDQHPDAFDIKKAIMPIIGFARIYGLKNHVTENNTLLRLSTLAEIGVISRTEFIQLRQLYFYLMNLRFRHQTGQILEGQVPDNYVRPGMLTDLDNTILKKIFSITNLVQTKLNFDFKGTAI